MDKKVLKGFKQEDKKGKVRIDITIDWDLKILLKKANINISELVNEFLWYYHKKRLEGGKKD